MEDRKGLKHFHNNMQKSDQTLPEFLNALEDYVPTVRSLCTRAGWNGMLCLLAKDKKVLICVADPR